MPDQASNKPKKRKLRQAPVTVRERAEQSAAKEPKAAKPSRLRAVFRPIGRLPIWKPFRFVRYLVPPFARNSWRELRMVNWPPLKQSWRLTSAVIIFALVFGVIVAVFDFGLDKLFREVITRR